MTDRLEEIKETLSAVKGLSKSGKLYDSALQDVDWLITELGIEKEYHRRYKEMYEATREELEAIAATEGTHD